MDVVIFKRMIKGLREEVEVKVGKGLKSASLRGSVKVRELVTERINSHGHIRDQCGLAGDDYGRRLVAKQFMPKLFGTPIYIFTQLKQNFVFFFKTYKSTWIYIQPQDGVSFASLESIVPFKYSLLQP